MVTGSLQTKGNKYYSVISYKDENNKRVQKWICTGLTTRGNKKEATQILEELKAEYEKKLSIKTLSTNTVNDILFADFMFKWLEIVKPTIEATTHTSYYQIINGRMYDYFKNKGIKLIDIQPIHIQEFYTYLLSQDLSGNTVIHYHANIRKALDYAYKMDLISNNPADKVQRPKKDMFISSFYNEQELNLLFEKAKDDPMEIAILLASFYGLRRSEVLGIKWSAIDFENMTITIKHTVNEIRENGKLKLIAKDRTKNKSSYRTLPLVADIVVVLNKLKQSQEQDKTLCGKSYNTKYKDYVCIDKMGSIIKPGYITQHFGILLKNNGLKKIRFHDLRHSCASLLLSRGVSMKEIQEWLGHSNYSTTANIYAHLDTNSKNNSANVLSKVLAVNKNTSTNKK